jgi:nitroreductase
MDAYLAIVTKREVRAYDERPLPDDVLHAILEAGRATGSSRNSQPWRFVVVTDRGRQRAVGKHCSRPGNFETSAVAIVVVLTDRHLELDSGRASQNMMVAAWAMGVGSCPNTPRVDVPDLYEALGLPDGASIPTILTLGYPAEGQRRPPKRADAKGVLSRIKRLPFERVVSEDRFRE